MLPQSERWTESSPRRPPVRATRADPTTSGFREARLRGHIARRQSSRVRLVTASAPLGRVPRRPTRRIRARTCAEVETADPPDAAVPHEDMRVRRSAARYALSRAPARCPGPGPRPHGDPWRRGLGAGPGPRPATGRANRPRASSDHPLASSHGPVRRGRGPRDDPPRDRARARRRQSRARCRMAGRGRAHRLDRTAPDRPGGAARGGTVAGTVPGRPHGDPDSTPVGPPWRAPRAHAPSGSRTCSTGSTTALPSLLSRSGRATPAPSPCSRRTDRRREGPGPTRMPMVLGRRSRPRPDPRGPD